MMEAVRRYAEGTPRDKIDQAALKFGMPMGPLELMDMVGLDIANKVGAELGSGAPQDNPLSRLVSAGKLGKKTGEGFYVWEKGKPKREETVYDEAELDRLGRELIKPMLDECERALADGIVANADHVDAGVIFGTGFAPFRGGPLHYRRSARGRRHSGASCVSGEGNLQAIMKEQGMRRVAVLGGVRIPFCRSHTAYAELSNLDMLTASLSGLIDRFSLHGAHIDEVVGGAVVTHAKDWNLAREAVIGSALSPTTPGITMMQACGTSLQGALGLGAKIATGQIDCGIALGSDTTSDAPIVFKRSFAQRLVQLSRAKSFGEKLAIFKGFTPAELAPQPPSTSEPRTGLGMGEHCELMAKEWGITREAEDLLAYESHKKAAARLRSGLHGRPGRFLAPGCSATTISARTSRWKRWPS